MGGLNMELSQKLKDICKATDTKEEGIAKLVEYYIKSLGWSQKEAEEYAIALFKDGTIKQIKVIGGKKK
jgi:hypothetical protein